MLWLKAISVSNDNVNGIWEVKMKKKTKQNTPPPQKKKKNPQQIKC